MTTTPSVSALLQTAVQAFEERERAQFLLDKKEVAVSQALLRLANHPDHEKVDDAYFEQTQEVIARYDAKRKQAGL